MKRELINQYLHPMTPVPTLMSTQGQLREVIKCVLFDIYGTLFISGSGDISFGKQTSPKMEEIKRLLTKYGIVKPPRSVLEDLYQTIEARHKDLRNNGVDHPEVIIEQIWPKVLENFDKKLIKSFAVEFELVANPVYPMPNLESMLTDCRRKKMLMGIISNAQFYTPYLFNWFLDAELAGLGFDPDLLFFSYQYGVAKPSRLLFKMAAERLMANGIQPDSVLYLGNDMLNDIYPARAVGFKTALFAGDRRSLKLREDDSRCAELSPDLVVTDLGQLSQFIDKKVRRWEDKKVGR
jgi:putative hydrolase of the HAD superfamily